jgi:hypothetical protein
MLWFGGSLRQAWDTPPAPPLGIPMSPLAPLHASDPNLALCKGSPWLSTRIAGDWDELFVKVGVFWPLRSAARALDYAVGFDEVHFTCDGPTALGVDVHIPIVEPLGEALLPSLARHASRQREICPRRTNSQPHPRARLSAAVLASATSALRTNCQPQPKVALSASPERLSVSCRPHVCDQHRGAPGRPLLHRAPS